MRQQERYLAQGEASLAAGDAAGAEVAFRAGLKAARGDGGLATALAELLAASGRGDEAIRVLRGALAENRRDEAVAAALARALTASGRAGEALLVTGRFAGGARPSHGVLAAHAGALKAGGQAAAALAVYERAALIYPDSAVAHHNLAASQGDLGYFAAAERSTAAALARARVRESGGREGGAAETWLVRARALAGAGRLDEAASAFEAALARAPGSLEAHRELAQLIWMRSGDADATLAPLARAIESRPGHAPFLALRARLLQTAGRDGEAYAAVCTAVAAHPDDAALLLTAAELAGQAGAPGEALGFAERALRLMPGEATAAKAVFSACVAGGDVAQANAVAEALVAARPRDQHALALQATAWRLSGDARYAALYDYATMVRTWEMDVPDGWSSLGGYLADLTEALGGLHPYRAHPIGQSVRHGSQATHLLASGDPVVRAFFRAVDGPIRRHLAALGRGRDALRVRNTGGYRFDGAWSVRLRPGGFHADHIHPDGWLSSACYIALPAMAGEGREAWIKFGEPGLPTVPALGAEHWVRPEAGMVVLFPSYMWHGTVPFSDAGARLSVAFDLLPGGADK